MKTKRIFLTALAVIVMLAGFSACRRKPAEGVTPMAGVNTSGDQAGLTLQPGILTIGMEIGYPPMEYYDSDGKTPIGFDVSMGKAIAAKMGLKVEFIDTAWDGIFASLDTEKFDCIMSSVTVTEERQKAHNFSKPYIGNSLAIVTLKNSAVKPRSPEELNGRGVSYQEETTSKFFMEKLVQNGLTYTPYEYDKVMYCFNELELGRVDVIVTDNLVAVDYIAIPDSPFEITWQGEADEVFGICIKKGNDALTTAIDKALDELFAEGTMHKLSREIFNMDMVSSARQ
ncbi:MAG: ABC transporter substrate-binding protein [Treponema sp.]|jgi:polar amino acid transport system substrate-binding protein|nr:ABC transporter substrate-binding protein [Treponema sp.]